MKINTTAMQDSEIILNHAEIKDAIREYIRSKIGKSSNMETDRIYFDTTDAEIEATFVIRNEFENAKNEPNSTNALEKRVEELEKRMGVSNQDRRYSRQEKAWLEQRDIKKANEIAKEPKCEQYSDEENMLTSKGWHRDNTRPLAGGRWLNPIDSKRPYSYYTFEEAMDIQKEKDIEDSILGAAKIYTPEPEPIEVGSRNKLISRGWVNNSDDKWVDPECPACDVSFKDAIHIQSLRDEKDLIIAKDGWVRKADGGYKHMGYTDASSRDEAYEFIAKKCGHNLKQEYEITELAIAELIRQKSQGVKEVKPHWKIEELFSNGWLTDADGKYIDPEYPYDDPNPNFKRHLPYREAVEIQDMRNERDSILRKEGWVRNNGRTAWVDIDNALTYTRSTEDVYELMMKKYPQFKRFKIQGV